MYRMVTNSKNNFQYLIKILLSKNLVTIFWKKTSVPDPKLIISDPDPDPQIENQEFRNWILLQILP